MKSRRLFCDGTDPPKSRRSLRNPSTSSLQRNILKSIWTARSEGFLSNLDPEQEKVARKSLRGPTLVKGGPGTGKSLVALYRIRNLMQPNAQKELFSEAPRESNIVTIDPTYGMYEVCADINNVAVRKVLLTSGFQLDTAGLLNAADENSRLLFLCSPNNPTSNSFKHDNILTIVQNFSGIVVLDEAYIDFSVEASLIPELKNFPNLVILQTFSKAWGLAGIRLVMAFARRITFY